VRICWRSLNLSTHMPLTSLVGLYLQSPLINDPQKFDHYCNNKVHIVWLAVLKSDIYIYIKFMYFLVRMWCLLFSEANLNYHHLHVTYTTGVHPMYNTFRAYYKKKHFIAVYIDSGVQKCYWRSTRSFSVPPHKKKKSSLGIRLIITLSFMHPILPHQSGFRWITLWSAPTTLLWTTLVIHYISYSVFCISLQKCTHIHVLTKTHNSVYIIFCKD